MEGQQVTCSRRRRCRAEVEHLVSEYQASGVTRTEFCRNHAISLSTLNRYLSRQQSAQAGTVGVNFVAVEVAASRPAETGGQNSGLALALPAGRRIEVARGFDAPTLVQLLGLLERF